MLEPLGWLIAALALTIAVETGIAWLLGLRRKNELIAVVLINVVTNPLLNYLLAVNCYYGWIEREWSLFLALEIAVVLAEWFALVYVLGLGRVRVLFLSIAFNGASYLAGWLVLQLING